MPVAPETASVLASVVAPVTPRVPAILVLPDEAATVNLLVFTSKSPSMPVAPETASVLASVVAPETDNVPCITELLFTSRLAPAYKLPDKVEPPSTVKVPSTVLLPATSKSLRADTVPDV